ncbi:MAG: hypothetical protein MZU97_00300 [Bacillus subtilis]|nr:hypothetical protein [Bacillus subtilis]
MSIVSDGTASFVLLPNPASVRLAINGVAIHRETQRAIHKKQWFDIETGTLEAESTYVVHSLKVKETIRVFAHMAQPNILIVDYRCSVDQAATIDLLSGVFGESSKNYNHLHFESKGETLTWKADTAKKGVKFIVADLIQTTISSPYEVLTDASGNLRHFHFTAEPNTTYAITKAIYFNHADKAGFDNPTLRLERAMRKGLDAVLKSNQVFWKSAWERYGLEIKGEEAVQTGMKAAMYRMISSRPVSDALLLTRFDESGETVVEAYYRSIDIDTLPVYLNCDVVAAETVVKRLAAALPRAKEAAARLGAAARTITWECPNRFKSAKPLASAMR